jgi:hypothetical protein
VKDFTDVASYRANNCIAIIKTNGVDLYSSLENITESPTLPPIAYFQQQLSVNSELIRKEATNVLLCDMSLFKHRTPGGITPALN